MATSYYNLPALVRLDSRSKESGQLPQRDVVTIIYFFELLDPYPLFSWLSLF